MTSHRNMILLSDVSIAGFGLKLDSSDSQILAINAFLLLPAPLISILWVQ